MEVYRATSLGPIQVTAYNRDRISSSNSCYKTNTRQRFVKVIPKLEFISFEYCKLPILVLQNLIVFLQFYRQISN